MKLTFLGTGDAFDPERATTSYLIDYEEAGASKTLLIDCGYTTPGNLMKLGRRRGASESEWLRAVPDDILVTHLHGDHFGSIPRLLTPAYSHGRTRPLRLIGISRETKDVYGTHFGSAQEAFQQQYALNYPGSGEKVLDAIPTSFLPIESTEKIGLFRIDIARTKHSIWNYAIKLSSPSIKIGISGDGSMTDESRLLFSDVDVLIHEAFTLSSKHDGHETAEEVVAFARDRGIKKVFLVHCSRELHAKQADKEAFLVEHSSAEMDVSFADDFDEIDFRMLPQQTVL